MTLTLDLVLLILAAISFALAVFVDRPLGPRINMVALGLLFWVLTALV